MIDGINKPDEDKGQTDHIGNKNIIIRPATPTYKLDYD